MKIENHETVRISEKVVGKNISSLPVGSAVDARIIKRLGGNDALLDINGKELRARFQNGAPASRDFSLILNGRKDGLLFFSMRANNGPGLARFLISDQIAAASNKALLRYLNAAPDSIFEFNRIAAGVDISGKGLAALFDSVAQKQGNPPWLFALANYLSFIGLGRELALLVNPDGRQRREGQKKPSDDGEAAKLEIAGIIEGIEMEELLASVLSGLSEPDAFKGVELPFFDGDGYTALKCISCEGAWVFQVDFSRIGRVEVMARKTEKMLYIDVFTESGEVSDALKKQGNPGTSVVFNFHSLKNSITKMLAIYNVVTNTNRLNIKA